MMKTPRSRLAPAIYLLTRLVLAWTIMISGCSLFLASVLTWPWSAFAIPALLVASWPRQRTPLTTLGSAAWADEGILQAAGMLDAQSGMILGRIACRRNLGAALCAVMTRQNSSEEDCEGFLRLFQEDCSKVVRLPQAIHTAVFAPSGVGKGVSCVIPFLRDCDESCVVIDFKGENAHLTAEHRRRAFGHRTVFLDPYGVITAKSDCYNPLDEIARENPNAIDECNDLAKSLVVRTAEEKEPHWNDSAEAWIATMAATVVYYGDAGESRSLQTVRDLFSTPERLDMALRLMRESPTWDGMLARMGGQLGHFVDREKSSTLSTVSRHLRFLDTPAIAAVTRQSTFDPAELLRGKMTIYLILPAEHMRAQAGLLRMWITSLLRAVIRGGVQTEKRVHFVCDEAASLGSLDVIEDAVDKYRGYGVRLQFYFQSLAQLKKVFPQGQDITLLSNTTQVFFGVNDPTTAEMVSNRLGEQTIVVDSGGTNDGTSSQQTFGGQVSHSASRSLSTSHNWQQQARKLLKPEEVTTLPPNVAITFVPGLPPIRTRLLRYYEEPTLGKVITPWGHLRQACCALTAALLLLAMSLAVAAGLTFMVSRLPGF